MSVHPVTMSIDESLNKPAQVAGQRQFCRLFERSLPCDPKRPIAIRRGSAFNRRICIRF